MSLEKTKAYLPDVVRHVDGICLRGIDFDCCKRKDLILTFLALILLESGGNTSAKNGSFVGLLQQGGPYLKDASQELKRKVTKGDVDGDADLAIEASAAYFRRYRSRTHYLPEHLALIHKCGAGFMRRFSKLDTDLSVDDRLKLTLKQVPIYNAEKYLSRFRKFYSLMQQDYSGKCL